MYGLFSIPNNASKTEYGIYKKNMCSICDAFHYLFGVKSRLFTNNDITTLSVIITSLCLSPTRNDNLLTHKYFYHIPFHKKEPHEIYKFLSSISVLLFYCKQIDSEIDGKNSKKHLKFNKYAEKANFFTQKYGISISYFDEKLTKQHELEKVSSNFEMLSAPTGEIISDILIIGSSLVNKSYLAPKLNSLGIELGKLLYLYDGLIDFHDDLQRQSFNCINRCFSNENFESGIISDKIINTVASYKKNISLLIDEIYSHEKSDLLKKILLQDIITQENGLSNRFLFGKNKKEFFTYLISSIIGIFGIPAVVLADDGAYYPSCGYGCASLCCLISCCCGGCCDEKTEPAETPQIPQNDPHFCENCGSQLTGDEAFCMNCGKKT